MDVLAWHFLSNDRRLFYGDRELVTEGSFLSIYEEPVLCERGFHGSVRAIDALSYAPGPIVCRVEIGGTIVSDTYQIVGRTRRVLWMIDATWVLHEFACRLAEQALSVAGVTNSACWAAIRAKRAWANEMISDEELLAAWHAGRSAWFAARGAADTAWYAAWYAARSKAWFAARGAADRAWVATWDAARPAVYYAARKEQNTLLESMLIEEHDHQESLAKECRT